MAPSPNKWLWGMLLWTLSVTLLQDLKTNVLRRACTRERSRGEQISDWSQTKPKMMQTHKRRKNTHKNVFYFIMSGSGLTFFRSLHETNSHCVKVSVPVLLWYLECSWRTGGLAVRRDHRYAQVWITRSGKWSKCPGASNHRDLLIIHGFTQPGLTTTYTHTGQFSRMVCVHVCSVVNVKVWRKCHIFLYTCVYINLQVKTFLMVLYSRVYISFS